MTIPTKYRRALAAMLATLTLLIVCGEASADNEFYYNIEYSMDSNYWSPSKSDGYNWGTPLTSEASILGVAWHEEGFAVQYFTFSLNGYDSTYSLAGGSPIDYTPYIQSEGSIEETISAVQVVFDISDSSNEDLVQNVVLKQSPTNDFSQYVSTTKKILTDGNKRKEIVFDVKQPSAYMYYRIEFTLSGSKKEKWLKLLGVRFGLPQSTLAQPSYSVIDGISGSYEVTLSSYNADFGLHVMWGKYNESGERLEYFYDGIEPTSEDVQNETDVITDLSKSWQNDVGQTYTHTFAPTGTDYYILRAKSVNKNDPYHQSNDIVKIIKADGIVTGIDGVNSEEANVGTEGNIRWFNLQGSPVAQPEGHGVFIRLCNGKSSKVLL